MISPRVAAAIGRAVAVRPRLWPTALRLAVTMVPSRWWRRRPFLPVPSAEYLRFRALTQYGDATTAPAGDDVAQYLMWCRDMRRHDVR